MLKSSIQIIFFGTSDFAVAALEALVRVGYEIAAVITAPDKPVGRKQILTPPPVKVTAQRLGLDVWQPKNLKIENLNLIGNWKLEIGNCDLGIVAAYGKLIPPEVFNLPKHGTLNIHPSLLPKYRGPSPIQTAILNGDTETGVTIMRVDEEMDHGDIVAAISYQLSAISSYKEAHDKLAKLGAELLIKTLPDYLAGKIKPQPQDHSKATFTKKFVTEDGEIKPDDTAKTAYNKICALNPEPGVFVMLSNGQKLKVLNAELPKQASSPKGNFLQIIDGWLVLLLNDGYIILKIVQPEGKKPMTGKEFARGYLR